MEKEILKLNGNRESLLLHSCCAPCSSAVLLRLREAFDITLFYYNPNIFPAGEYEKRLKEQKKLLSLLGGIEFIEGKYKHDDFLKLSSGLENEAEGKSRCERCYKLRLEETACVAEKNNFKYFTTTLSVSPHKKADLLNGILEETAIKYRVKPLFADFKKKDGYKQSIELSKEYDLYRQEYCGCEFSVNNMVIVN